MYSMLTIWDIVHIHHVDIRIYEQWTHLAFFAQGKPTGKPQHFSPVFSGWDGTFPGRFLGALAYWTQPLKLFIPSLRMWDTWASPASTSWRKSLPGRNPPSPGGLEQIFCGLGRGPQRSGGNAPFLLDWFWSFLQLKSPCFATQDLNHNSSWTNYHWWLKSFLFAGRISVLLEHVGTKVTTIMVVVLLIISSLFGYAAWLHRTSGQNGNLSRKEEILISVLRTGKGIQASVWSWCGEDENIWKKYTLKNLHRNLVGSPKNVFGKWFSTLGTAGYFEVRCSIPNLSQDLEIPGSSLPSLLQESGQLGGCFDHRGHFFLQGWFMANVSSVIKIASRSTKGRPAPATWAFFTPDSVQADLLRTAPTISKLLSHPLGTSIGG